MFLTGTRARYFLFSFSLAFCAWSVLYLFLAYVVHPRASELQSPAAAVQEPAYKPEARDSLTVLFMGAQSLNTPPSAYLLARFDPVNGRMAISALPGNLQADHMGKAESLAEIYAYGGGLYTRDVLAKTLGITIDRQVRLTPDSFLLCAQAVGSVEFDLPEPRSILRDGVVTEFAKGLQLLDGKRALQLLRFGSGTQAESLNLLAAFAACAAEQRRDAALSALSDQVFERIVNSADTDISYTDYMDRKSALEYFARLPGFVTKTVTLSGREENGCYVPADTFIAEILSIFG